MKNYNLNQINTIINGQLIGDGQTVVNEVFFDSRIIVNPIHGIFFALSGNQKNGHHYVHKAYELGIRNFVVQKSIATLTDANFIVVDNPLVALQQWAKFHREQYTYPVIAITGSNGKTIVKEWLNQLLWKQLAITRSPKSYNSQIGVPLSILQMDQHHELAILEAGISKPNEMHFLGEMIQPTVGVLTKIGTAHLENFIDEEELIKEKLQLFHGVKKLVYNIDNQHLHQLIQEEVELSDSDKITYGKSKKATVQVLTIERGTKNTVISIEHNQKMIDYTIPFTDEASIKNSLICLTTLIALSIDYESIISEFNGLIPIEMRLEIKEAINDSILINDSFNSDLNSLKIGLDVLNQQSRERKSLILTDILQSNLKDDLLYEEVARLVNPYHFTEVVLIGEKIATYKHLFETNVRAFKTTDDYLAQFNTRQIHDEAILLKGARPFQLEKISEEIEKRSHDTVLEINLEHLKENINTYRSLLRPTTKLMCMVKANSYGTGSFEIANSLQNNAVDYLGVAIADEGKELRQAGITLPIIVMNPEQSSYSTVIDYQLEPEIYSIRVLELFLKKLHEKQISARYPIHLKIESGMNRLGFHESDLPTLVASLKKNPQVEVKSIFTHLATADIKDEKKYVDYQLKRFDDSYQYICESLGIQPIKHALNSPGIVAYPAHQYDMVRLGIGMYGYSEYTEFMNKLRPVVRFRTVISQISEIQSGETVSYGRRFTADKRTKIATLPVGYADGIRRSLGYGKGAVSVNGMLAPIIGTICMDMMMVDVSEINCQEGDQVTIFGESPSLSQVSQWLNTIPYEVLTSVSYRVKRVYYKE